MQDLIQMLKGYEIENIISIDDGWSTDGNIEEKIEKKVPNSDITVINFCEEYGIEIDAEEWTVCDKFFYTPMRNLKTIESKIPKTFAEIWKTLGDDIDATLKTLDRVLSQLHGIFNVEIGNEFERSYQTIDGNNLYILDINMGEKRENQFIDYILNILDKRKEHKDLIIVYSNEISEPLGHDAKVEYLDKNNKKGKDLEVLYQFWPLPKTTDEKQLISGLKEMISKSMYGKALSKMIEMKRTSIEGAFKDLLQINIDNLDDMIIDSYVEGGKITESYELLIDSLIKKNASELPRDVLDYEKGLLGYSAKRSKEIIKEKKACSKTQYNRLREESNKRKLLNPGTLRFNVADYSINQKYENPSMGDIYVFTEAKSKKKYAGMLISQECSIMIRMVEYPEGIKRKADELLLLLFDIVEITEDSIKGVINKLDDCIWPIEIDNKMCLLKNTKRSMCVSPEILDLCGLNPSGKAKIEFNKESLEYKSAYSQKYYKNLEQNVKQKIEDTVNRIIQTDGKETRAAGVRDIVISLAYGIEFNKDFNLQRICKIDEKQTLHIIHEYLNGIAKIGLPVIPNV